MISLVGILVVFGGLVWTHIYLGILGFPPFLSVIEFNNVIVTFVLPAMIGFFILTVSGTYVERDHVDVVFHLNSFFAVIKRIRKKKRDMISNQELAAEPLRKAMRALDKWLRPNVTIADKHTLVPKILFTLMFHPRKQTTLLKNIKEFGVAAANRKSKNVGSTLNTIAKMIGDSTLRGVKAELDLTWRERFDALWERESTRNQLFMIILVLASIIFFAITGQFLPFG